MNKEILYIGNVCKLCGFEDRDHADDCPGRAIEGMTYEVTYEGPRCLRSCCGYIEGRADGATLEACVHDAAVALDDAVRHRCEARLIYTLDVNVNEMVTKELTIIRAAAKAKADAAKAEEARRRQEKALATLEAERGDLTPEAYERRREALLTST